MSKWILISGKAGAGKNTLANYMFDALLSPKIPEYKISLASFGNYVKEVAYSMGWDGNKDFKGRQLLQKIGSAGREYYQDVWADKLCADVERDSFLRPSYILIPDWRYPNEFQYICNEVGMYDTVLGIRIEGRAYDLGVNASHDSENSLPLADVEGRPTYIYYDYIVDNSGSLDDLKQKAIEIVKDITKS